MLREGRSYGVLHPESLRPIIQGVLDEGVVYGAYFQAEPACVN